MPEFEEVEQNAPNPVEGAESEETANQTETTQTKPQGVDYARFQEVNQRMQQAEQRAHELQVSILQLQQAQLQQQRKQNPEPVIDREVEDLVAPILRKHLGPYEQRMAELQQREAAMWANQEAQAAWDYVRTEVPDMDDLAPDMQAYLQSIPTKRANLITSDPDLVIQTAELVRARKSAGLSISNTAAKQDLKQRGKGDSGSAPSPIQSTKNVNWAALSDAEFDAMERKMGIKNR